MHGLRLSHSHVGFLNRIYGIISYTAFLFFYLQFYCEQKAQENGSIPITQIDSMIGQES